MRHLLAAVSAVALLGSAAGASAGEAPAASKAPVPLTGPIPIGVEQDVYCAGYLGDVEEAFVGRLVNAEKEQNQTMFMAGDVMYIDAGSESGVTPGMEFTIVRPTRLVNRWGSEREHVGRIYMTPGRLRVICVQEKTSIAEIVYSCNEVDLGDFVSPFEPIPVPLVRRTTPVTLCDAPNGKPIGHIVDTRDAVTPIGATTVVFLDLGEADGLSPGDFLTVYRSNSRAVGVRTVLGEAAILTTRNTTSVAIITSMIDNMAIGDEVEVK
jgi:hypothetical protein